RQFARVAAYRRADGAADGWTGDTALALLSSLAFSHCYTLIPNVACCILPWHSQEAWNMELWSRRKFFLTSLAGSTLAGANKIFGRTPSNGDGGLSLENPAPPSPGKPAATGKRPLLISSANGLHALDKGMDILQKGGDTLDAVVAEVTVVEDDPNDDSV